MIFQPYRKLNQKNAFDPEKELKLAKNLLQDSLIFWKIK